MVVSCDLILMMPLLWTEIETQEQSVYHWEQRRSLYCVV